MTALLLAFLLWQGGTKMPDRISFQGIRWPSPSHIPHILIEGNQWSPAPVNVCIDFTAKFCDVTMGSRSSYFELMQEIRPDGRVLRYTYGAGDLPWKRDRDTWEEFFVTKQDGWAAWRDSEGGETVHIPADVHFVAKPSCPIMLDATKTTVVKTHTGEK